MQRKKIEVKKGKYAFLVDGLRKEPINFLRHEPLNEIEILLGKGAKSVEYYGTFGGEDGVLLLVVEVSSDGPVITEGGNLFAFCKGCGELIRSEHGCVRGSDEPCKEKFRSGTSFLTAPLDHPCAALYHAAQDGKFLVGIDNPMRVPDVPSWVLIQNRKTHGGGHHYHWFGRSGLSPEGLADFFRRHPASDAEVSLEGEVVVVKSSQLGPWIGSSGRWAKAYQRLGIRVQFRPVVATA
ncbi:hypothetical protein IPJ70_00580 [Candidatus Campbellbacteria bacterium]|nr:MAG: hypothetical protein IPJ70_00580 [Candidatus Campbellbacteria bacterium]